MVRRRGFFCRFFVDFLSIFYRYSSICLPIFYRFLSIIFIGFFIDLSRRSTKKRGYKSIIAHFACFALSYSALPNARYKTILSRLFAATVFILFTASARARIVAPGNAYGFTRLTGRAVGAAARFG